MLFHTTAFKIFERRMVTAVQSGRAIGELGKKLRRWVNWDKAMSKSKP
jgi:hypothetical protein